MKHLLEMFEIEGLHAVWALTFACICMWGCSDVDFRWESGRSSESVVGFVGDSLVIVGDYRCWLEIRDSWIMASEESSGCGRERLCVYNYRVQDDGPRWCDSLSSKDMTGIFGGQMTDSVIWGGEISESVQLWKIGERPHEIKLTKKSEGCSVEFRISSLKQWLDETFIGRGGESLAADGDTCNYAVLDTVAGTLTYKRLDKDLEWIKACDDVRAWGDDVFCMSWNDWHREGVLKKNQQDSLSVSFEFGMGGFWGNVIELGGHFCSLIDGRILCAEDVLWVRPLKFKRYDEVILDLSE